MSKKFSSILAILVVFAMLLSACKTAATPEAAEPAAEEETALAVGIVLPTKDEPRWIQEETRFTDALTAAGYNVEILLARGILRKRKPMLNP